MSSAHRTNDDVWLVVPLFNEETVIADVVRDARKTFPNIVVVDDGSSDHGADAAASAGAMVVRHPVNLGQGAALQTGFEYALGEPTMRWVVNGSLRSYTAVTRASLIGSSSQRRRA